MLRPLEAIIKELATLQTPEGKIARDGIAALRRMVQADDGRRILAMLAMVAHPYYPRTRDTALETGQADGRGEVVALLISLAYQGAIAPEVLTETTPYHATPTERTGPAGDA